MEKKSQARSLKDISRAFITGEDESIPDEPSLVFLSNPVREESCSACINVIEEPQSPLKCKIFSSKNKKFGGPFSNSTIPEYAKYCRYFQPRAAHDAGNNEEIDKSDMDVMQNNMEVEEIITSQKNIVLQADENLQSNFKKMLSQHLDQGYEIVRIELEKKDERKKISCLTKIFEKVTISRKDNL